MFIDSVCYKKYNYVFVFVDNLLQQWTANGRPPSRQNNESASSFTLQKV